MISYRRAVIIGLSSHLCASCFPFLAKEALGVFGAYRGALFVYIVAVILGWAFCVAIGKSSSSAKTIGTSLCKPKLLGVFLIMMGLATVSVLLFYGGLAQATPGEFTFVVRLEHVMALVLGMAILRERGHMFNLFGAAVGFSGWLLVVNFSSVQGTALWYALGYIVTSGAASMLAKKMLSWIDDLSFFLLRMTATMATLMVMTGLLETHTVSSGDVTKLAVLSTFIGGLVLAMLFMGRYFSMKRVPLWLYSSMSATQMVFTPVLAWALGKPMSWQVILGGCIVTIGVIMVNIPFQKKELEPQMA